MANDSFGVGHENGTEAMLFVDKEVFESLVISYIGDKKVKK